MDASTNTQIVASYQLNRVVIVNVALLFIGIGSVGESMRRKEEPAHRVL